MSRLVPVFFSPPPEHLDSKVTVIDRFIGYMRYTRYTRTYKTARQQVLNVTLSHSKIEVS